MLNPENTRVALTLADYQARAISTAEPRAFHLDYLIPGIIGEVGELFGQRAKSYWHGWEAKKLRAELVSEYGDIAWMTALLLHTRGVSMLQPHFTSTAGGRYGVMEPHHALLSAAQNLYLQSLLEAQGISDSDGWMDESAERMWRLLRDNCLLITETPFQDVLHANLTKLSDRAARGVLRGSGDHR